jgi:hypothetical protein
VRPRRRRGIRTRAARESPRAPRCAPLQVLTPEEFVAAGDALVHACPTWNWCGPERLSRRPSAHSPRP